MQGFLSLPFLFTSRTACLVIKRLSPKWCYIGLFLLHIRTVGPFMFFQEASSNFSPVELCLLILWHCQVIDDESVESGVLLVFC